MDYKACTSKLTRDETATAQPASTTSRYLQKSADPNLITAERGGADFMIDRSSRCDGVRPTRFDVINADVTELSEEICDAGFASDQQSLRHCCSFSHAACPGHDIRTVVKRQSHQDSCPVMFYAYSLRCPAVSCKTDVSRRRIF